MLKQRCHSNRPTEPEDHDFSASKLQLQLAATILGRLIERNGGPNTSDAFRDYDLSESAENCDRCPNSDPDDLDEETLPEMELINWNIYECD